VSLVIALGARRSGRSWRLCADILASAIAWCCSTTGPLR